MRRRVSDSCPSVTRPRGSTTSARIDWQCWHQDLCRRVVTVSQHLARVQHPCADGHVEIKASGKRERLQCRDDRGLDLRMKSTCCTLQALLQRWLTQLDTCCDADQRVICKTSLGIVGFRSIEHFVEGRSRQSRPCRAREASPDTGLPSQLHHCAAFATSRGAMQACRNGLGSRKNAVARSRRLLSVVAW